jgi:hypothetical protein
MEIQVVKNKTEVIIIIEWENQEVRINMSFFKYKPYSTTSVLSNIREVQNQ